MKGTGMIYAASWDKPRDLPDGTVSADWITDPVDGKVYGDALIRISWPDVTAVTARYHPGTAKRVKTARGEPGPVTIPMLLEDGKVREAAAEALRINGRGLHKNTVGITPGIIDGVIVPNPEYPDSYIPLDAS